VLVAWRAVSASPPFAGYVRVSAVGGRAGDRFRSPADQAQAIRRWSEDNGVAIVMLDPELDRSGGDRTRPVLEEAVRGVEAGAYAGVVVAYLSRAGRSLLHLLHTYARVEGAGGQVVSVAERLDTATSTGRLTRNLFAAMAEFELDMHRERFDALRRDSVARGVWSRHQTPRGYEREAVTRRLLPSHEAEEIRAVFTARRRGAPITELADRLGMTPSGTRKLLANRTYLGELRDGPYVNADGHPAIVSPALFAAVQRTRAPAASSTPSPRSLLAGLARCGSCGAALARTSSPRARGGWAYACHSRNLCPQHVAMVGVALDDHVRRECATDDEAALREGIQAVVVAPVGRGRRVPVGARVTILASDG
jgi:DNA invertase Pin-like site-specific DNA recombinase